MIIRLINKSVFAVLFLMVLASSFSCTKFFDPPQKYEEYEEIIDTTVKKKVLVIAIEGLVGSQLKLYMPAYMSKLKEHSKYSYETKSDINTNGYASWATLMTGIPSDRHKVTKESFMVDIDKSVEHASYSFTPSIIKRLKSVDSKIRAISVVQNPTMSAMIFADADSAVVTTSDDKAIELSDKVLKTSRVDLLFTQLDDVKNAGINGGFVISNPNYKKALDNVDAKIEKLVQAIESRANYKKEKWLVIITSPQGGTAIGTYGGRTFDEVNTFSMYYNKSFLSNELRADAMQYFNANGYFQGTHFKFNDLLKTEPIVLMNEGARVQTPTGSASNIYNASNYASKEITYEFKFKLLNQNHWYGDYGYINASFISKDLDDSVNTKGWSMFAVKQLTGNHTFNLTFQNGDTTSYSLEFDRGRNEDWHHYAIVLKQITADSTAVRVYIDGINKLNKGVPLALADFESDAPLTIGYRKISKLVTIPNFNIADFRVWNKALTVEEINTVSCSRDIPTSNALRANMVAYYRDISESNMWLSQVPSVPNLKISGLLNYQYEQNYKLCTPQKSEVYMQVADVLPVVFYWFDKKVSSEWGLTGKEFLDTYFDEFWRD